jgi:hypothetical protein
MLRMKTSRKQGRRARRHDVTPTPAGVGYSGIPAFCAPIADDYH